MKPNILLIVADDLGYGDLSAMGNRIARTPSLDQLAGEGVTLTQHYSASPVCAPSRAALLTGRYPQRTGVVDTFEHLGLDRLGLRESTLADRLREAGYRTGLMGKWHLGALDDRFHPLQRGFDEFVGFTGGWSDYWDYSIFRGAKVAAGDGRYMTDLITDEAIEFMSNNPDRPWFLHVAYNAPHFPLQAPQEMLSYYKDDQDLTKAVQTIYAMNESMDRGIGRLIEYLDGFGALDDTVVIFVSDNGPDFRGEGEDDKSRYNGFLAGSKGLVLEGGIRVPAIFRWPNGLSHEESTNDTLVHFTDWMPTLLEIAGAPTNPTDCLPSDGRSFLDILRGSSRDHDQRRYWQWSRYAPTPYSNAAVRDGPWKLVRGVIPETMEVDPDDIRLDRLLKEHQPSPLMRTRVTDVRYEILRQPPMLFNLATDPGESKDLSIEEANTTRRLERQLDEWFDEVERERRDA